jgi:protein-tyrosine-phosphatase
MTELQVASFCTGNAARSVMADVLLAEHVPAFTVTTSGTHVPVSRYAHGRRRHLRMHRGDLGVARERIGHAQPTRKIEGMPR